MLDSEYESDDFFDDDSDATSTRRTSAPRRSRRRPNLRRPLEPRRLINQFLRPTRTLKTSSKKDASGKTIEQIYQKKTQLEHILLRPDTYSKYRDAPTIMFYLQYDLTESLFDLLLLDQLDLSSL